MVRLNTPLEASSRVPETEMLPEEFTLIAPPWPVLLVPLSTTAPWAIVNAPVVMAMSPALPEPRTCTFCDYRVVCGPYEELRTSRKPEGPASLSSLQRLRSWP